MKLLLLFILLAIATFSVYSQTTKKVLFIGNSYTAANDLPQLVNNMAQNTGDVLEYDANTPEGARFMDHAINPTTLDKIDSDSWGYVVLQSTKPRNSIGRNTNASRSLSICRILE